MGAGRGPIHLRGRRRRCSAYDGHYFPYEDGKKRSRGQKIVQIRQKKEIFGLGSAARLVMCDAGRALLLATAYRMREEVLTFGDCLAKDRIALLKGLDHLEAPLLLIERLLAPFTMAGRSRIDLTFVNTACRHYHLAIDAFLAVAPAFRKAQAVRHKWIRNRGKICAKIRSCCSTICCGCHCHKHPPMARRMARARKIFEDLEIKHEASIIDLALTYEYYLSSPAPPPPDAPARCLAAGSFILAAQRKLHQINCHFLQPRDKVTMGMAEWTLEEAAADLRVAHAKLKTLPRRMRTGRRRGRRAPPLVTFGSPPDCLMQDTPAWCPTVDNSCEACRESHLSETFARHVGIASHLPCLSAGPLVGSPASPCMLPVSPAAPVATMASPLPVAQTVAVSQLPVPQAVSPVAPVPVQRVQCVPSQVQLPSVGLPVWGGAGGQPLYTPVAPPVHVGSHLKVAPAGVVGGPFHRQRSPWAL